MTHRIEHLSAHEILDSRGRPTLEVTARLASGKIGIAGVPSGASTGSGEAVELRDDDPSRYGGAGVTIACRNVSIELARLLVGRSWGSIRDIDDALIELDGTPSKRRLGANAIVGTWMAAAKAMAAAEEVPLYRWLDPDQPPRLPVPHFNVINGGAHAQNRLEFQEFMVAPLGAASYAEALRAGAEVYGALRGLLHHRGLGTGLGDEGGFAPDVATPEEALDLLVEAIAAAGHSPGLDDIAIALDPAASEFVEPDGRYRYSPGERLTSTELIARYEQLIDRVSHLVDRRWDRRSRRRRVAEVDATPRQPGPARRR